jgi:multidrug efflux pump subunit AcrB
LRDRRIKLKAYNHQYSCGFQRIPLVHPDLRKRKEPNLPTDVNQYGLTIRKSTGLAMILISLYSPNRTYDSLFLANSATINVNDALYRVPGVGEVRVFGARLQRVNLEW